MIKGKGGKCYLNWETSKAIRDRFKGKRRAYFYLFPYDELHYNAYRRAFTGTLKPEVVQAVEDAWWRWNQQSQNEKVS